MSKKSLCLFLLVSLLFTFVESGYADDPNLVGWYHLDESSGTVAADSSVKSNNGTVTGATWAPTSGQFNGALNFAGTTHKLQIPSTYLKASKGTLSGWARIEGSQSGARYIFGHLATNANRIELYCDGGNNQLDIGLGGSHTVATNVFTFAANTWYQVALTWNASNWSVYVNGESKGSGTYSNLNTIGTLLVGNEPTVTAYQAWQGKIDEVRIYDRALSAPEIAALYTPVAPVNPNPAHDATNVLINTTLSWMAGYGATAHNVYFGTDAGSLPEVAHEQPDTTYDPGILQLGTTYYWKVEEISPLGTTAGNIWNFTTDTGCATNPNPANEAQFVALDTALSWAAGTSATSHDVYMGTAPGSLILLQAGLTATSFDPGGLNPGITYYWRIDEHNPAGVAAGNIWNFKTEGPANDPVPADSSAGLVVNVALSWAPGIASGSQDVYFGTNFSDVNNASRPACDIDRDGQANYADIEILAEQWLTNPLGTGPSADLDGNGNVDFVDFALAANTWLDSANSIFKGNQPIGSNSFSPGTLDAETTYYWRIDQVKGSTIYKGDVWSFTTVDLAAFPGAEGWAFNTVGGRGGQVIKVTNLNSSGPGSLNAACATSGPRIVVFDVSGVIRGDVRITQPYLTIAGQTAPGGGITIAGRVSSFDYHAHDVIIRHVRVRPPPVVGSTGDGFQLGGSNTYNFVLDHCSVAWGSDEVIDFYWAHDMSVQWCTIEESDPCGHDKGIHNFGMISAAEDSGAVSVHHNLWAHHYRRVPCMAPYRQNATDDFRNNVVYDVYGGLTHDGHEGNVQSPLNNFYNYWKRGPSSWSRIYPFATVVGPQYYIYNNYFVDWGLKGHPSVPAQWSGVPAWVQYNSNGAVLTSPGYVPPITTHVITDAASATTLYNTVLAKAGAWPRDRVTLRTISETQIGGSDPCTGGSYGRHAEANPSDAWFMEGLTPTAPPTDTDGDGMPDTWETAHGLNPNNAADRNNIVPAGASAGDRHRGYTYIEYYINEKADLLVP